MVRSVGVAADIRRAAGSNESLLHADRRLAARQPIDPVREIKSSRCRNRFLLECAERADVDGAELRDEVDVRWPAKRVRDRVAAVIMRSGAQRMASHAALVAR